MNRSRRAQRVALGSGRAFAIDRALVVAAANAARTRIDDLLTRLTDAIGEDPWGFRAIAR